MRLTALVLAGLLPLPAVADDPWGQADPKTGKALHDKSCISCHARSYGGDGSRIYTRSGRIVGSKAQLMQRVAICSGVAKAGWSPAQEAAVAAWLNQQYYRFGANQ